MAKKKAKNNRWSHKVTTVSTYPPEGIFTKDAHTIADVMARKDVSPKGTGSAIRMVTFFINRAGTTLPSERKKELEEAKQILRERLKKEKDG
jgi:tRNA(adenine34) deaminase